MSAKLFTFSLIIFLLFTYSAPAQQTPVDKVVTDLYESISFSEDKEPDYEKFKSLFAGGGQLVSVRDTVSYRLTPADYEKMMTKQRESGQLLSFIEKELHRTTEQYGNILHVFSTYQTHAETPNETDTERGINSIQLIKQDESWKVTSIVWYQESKEHPIPEKYLSGNNN